MFGKERFQFESPNAVDAGDDLPPAAPNRDKHTHEADLPPTPPTPARNIINTSMTFGDARDSASDFLKDIEVSPTRGPHSGQEKFRDEDEYREYEDDDDEEGQDLRKSLTHSSNLARSKATQRTPYDFSLLSQPKLEGDKPLSSWRRPNRRNRRFVPRSSQGITQNLHDMPDNEPGDSIWNKKVVLCLCLVPLILIVLVSVPLARHFNGTTKTVSLQNDNTSSPTKQEVLIPFKDEDKLTNRLLETIDMLIDSGISDRQVLEVQGTPQNLAAEWMANVDPLQYEVPTADMEFADSYHFIQRYVLVVLFYSTGGSESWANDLGFLSEDHECSWFHSKKFTDGQVYAMGVTCRGDDLLISDILIPANGLKGTLPAELSILKSLVFLSLSHNEIEGRLPDLSGLDNLEYLDLGTNKISGSIPDWIDSWSRLKVLGLENNRLTGTITESMAALTDLVTLDLKSNSLQGNMDVANGLYNLEYLYLSDNGFAGYIDEELFLYSQKMLREVDISSNLFYADGFPHALLSKPQLRMLDISDNGFRGTLPETIPENNVLESLEINGNTFTGEIPSSIESLANLRHLDASQNSFVGAIPDHFVNLRELTYLSLGENDFTAGPIPAFLSSFSQLRELSLARCNIIGRIPQWFDILTNLRFLNLQENKIDGEVPQELWDLPELSMLLLTGNNLNGTLPNSTANSEHLEILALDDNNFGGEADTLCNAAPSLLALSFDCTAVTCTTECCNTCCEPGIGVDTASCFSKQLMNGLGREQTNWEFKYRSSGYSFSPDIVYGTQVDQRAGLDAGELP